MAQSLEGRVIHGQRRKYGFTYGQRERMREVNAGCLTGIITLVKVIGQMANPVGLVRSLADNIF